MKTSKTIIACAVAAASAAAAFAQSAAVNPFTYLGRVTDATINYIILETPDGESVSMSIRGTNPMMVPGVLPGDCVRVAYEVLPDGETLRAVQLDITSPSAYRLIPGIWRDCSGPVEVGLVLAEDGSAQITGVESVTLQDWSLDGEQLAFTAVDPADPKSTCTLLYFVEKLDADSLVIKPVEGATLPMALGRQP